ncbi:hypothetical protein [Ammoniphilus sp. YIM 78166]|uniref:hypothetical protein n=1 Tax=Ammoniphilus sp. YIM 78166 TaxID=1644106 RepID=UPI001430E437|nr:hypothetical protein [Ammoniphilus sp. YIM 78166]
MVRIRDFGNSIEGLGYTDVIELTGFDSGGTDHGIHPLLFASLKGSYAEQCSNE